MSQQPSPPRTRLTGFLEPGELAILQRLAGNAATTVLVQRDKAPATAPTTAPAKPTPAAVTPSPHDQAMALQKQFQPIFAKLFGKYGAREHFEPRSVKVIPDKADKDTVTLLDDEAQYHLQLMLKMAPEAIRDWLQKYYKAQDKKWPPAAYEGGFDEHTRLLPDDRDMLKAEILRHSLTDVARSDVGGFYSLKVKSIVVKQSSVDRGTLIHEMAHGCADTGWSEAMVMAAGLRLTNAHELSEGMTCLVADAVAAAWVNETGETVPDTGYGPAERAVAKKLLADVGEDFAYKAYFGGQLDVDEHDPSILLFGPAKKKKWPWPWK